MVGKLAYREFREHRSACIALGQRLGLDGGGDDLVIRFAHGLVADSDSHIGIGGRYLQVL